jgi:hypothetical protein
MLLGARLCRGNGGWKVGMFPGNSSCVPEMDDGKEQKKSGCCALLKAGPLLLR